MHQTDVVLQVVSRLPDSLRRDYLGRSDRAVRDVLEAVGAPQMRHAFADGLFIEPLRRGLLGGPHLQLPVSATPYGWPLQDPMRSRPAYAQPSDLDPQPGSSVRIRRIPWAMCAETTLPIRAGGITNANPGQYVNGTGYRFVITHLTLSESLEPLLLNPTYSLRIIPQGSPPWMQQVIPAAAVMSYRHQAQIPAVAAFPVAAWHLGAEYVANQNHSFFATADNPAAGGGITADLALVAYKRNQIGSPRIFYDTLALAASATNQPFNSANLTGDGDFPFVVTDILMSSGGAGLWQAGANVTAPRYYVRSDLDREFTLRPTLAVNLNTVEGDLGNFLRLANPQPLETGTSVQIELVNANAQAQVIANVGFVGYLEQPVREGEPMANA